MRFCRISRRSPLFHPFLDAILQEALVGEYLRYIRACGNIFLRRGSRPGRRYSEEGGRVSEGHVREVVRDWYFHVWFYEDVKVAMLISLLKFFALMQRSILAR